MPSYSASLIGYATGTLPFAVTGMAAAVSGASGSVGASPMSVAGKAAGASSAFGSVLGPADLYSSSDVGYATGTLSDPVQSFSVAGKAAAVSSAFGSVAVYRSSDIGFATGIISDPPPPRSPSLIGYVTGVLTGPGGGGWSSSQIGFATGVLNAPHLPVGVLMPDGNLRFVPVRTWDGAQLR